MLCLVAWPSMKIEHLALNIKNARGFVDWYSKYLGMPIHRELEPIRTGDGDALYVAFLGEAPGLIEIYENPSQAMLDLAAVHPLTIHLAFVSHDLNADRDRLVQAGATHLEGEADPESGYGLMMLRCPWGLPIQLCHRPETLYNPA